MVTGYKTTYLACLRGLALGNYASVELLALLKARMLEQKTGSYRVCYDSSCQIELGREVAAQKTLATRILKVGASCVITSQLYDLKTSTTEKAATARVDCSADKLLEGLDQIARQLATP